jgi:glycosyltransferase involved in cell wall biosynthesis
MKIAVIAPVLNEAQFIGYSIMSCHKQVEEFIYAVSPKSNDGTIDMLQHIAKRYGKLRLLIHSKYDFDPHDMKAYNSSFNDCIEKTRCDAVWFLHPDMIVTQWNDIPRDDSLAWWTKVTSYAKDINTVITKGRCTQWKNLHAKKFGLHYFGGYGSQNEDFYHSAITGQAHKHYGTEFSKYPYRVASSGIEVDHYCENKPYERRLEKMKLCLKTLGVPDEQLEEMALLHPRVTLEPTSTKFGQFKFGPRTTPIPYVFEKYGKEFGEFQRKLEVV